jgi:hypothetical protein
MHRGQPVLLCFLKAAGWLACPDVLQKLFESVARVHAMPDERVFSGSTLSNAAPLQNSMSVLEIYVPSKAMRAA